MNKRIECLRCQKPRKHGTPNAHTERPTDSQARVFIYQELNHGANDIRLLRILPKNSMPRKGHVENSSEVHCELFHANLDQHPSYKALSYTWGSDTSPKHIIYLDGCQFEVRENLWCALNRFQSDNIELIIWIDAIYINQTIDRERNHQVAKMNMIYEQATEVVV